ncbi:MAG: hypothetical protein RL637_954 [Pseudomonadota bacterium]
MNCYCLDDIIYQSLNSTLYRAFNRQADQIVILKCFEIDTQHLYLREMSGFGLQHPNLINCLDTFYLSDGRPCIVLEYFSAGSLADWLIVNHQADLSFCYHCLHDILQALIYLNQHKRIHCDIKPENIFLRDLNLPVPQFVLADLGATCSLREAQESRYGVGTPAYIAPERLYEKFFFNSDLYSLGILAFELITGQRPFLGTPEMVKRAHLTQSAEFSLISDISMCGLIEGLLEKKPTLRIANAETALAILEAIHQGQPITESPLNHTANSLTLGKINSHIPIAFKWHSELSINYPTQKILLGESNQQLIVGLDYETHIELIPIISNKRTMIVKSGISQAYDLHSFFYTNSLKLFRLQLDCYQRQCIYQFNQNIDYFQIQGHYLLLRGKYDNLYVNLSNYECVKFSQSHYFALPQACILTNGNFALSGGNSNQELILRNQQTTIIQQWQFQGPIMALTQTDNCLLALTLDMNHSTCYWLWSIAENQPDHYQIFSNTEILYYCSTEGYFFWLNHCHQLYMCHFNLIPQFITQLPTDLVIIQLQLTLDHDWLVLLVKDHSQTYKIICFKAKGVLKHDE